MIITKKINTLNTENLKALRNKKIKTIETVIGSLQNVLIEMRSEIGMNKFDNHLECLSASLIRLSKCNSSVSVLDDIIEKHGD